MQKIKSKCDICGKESEKDSSIVGEIDSGIELVKVPIKGIGSFLRKFTMHLCAEHYLEYYSNNRNWVKKQSTLDEYMELRIVEAQAPQVSET